MARDPPPYAAVDPRSRPGATSGPHYQNLGSLDTFRLLKLHAGREHDIVCSLHNYELSSPLRPPYTALSYTWDQDRAPSYTVNFPDGSTITVRKNLRNAFLSLRHTHDDRWLWIDAICIDQNNNGERNHQVRLMAEIYGNANIVLVWLQSAGESPHVSRAFSFIHAAVTYDHSEQSVRNYIKAHEYDNQRNWRSVQHLCALRYWTRKWIIQELIGARTVVLQAGKVKCSMEDLEAFCRQMRQAHRAHVSFGTGSVGKVLDSPAARLALQRAELEDEEQQPRMLWDLIERYADNGCSQHCDHVYALYSLSGPHRRHLRIDYSSRPLERLVTVVRFALHYEGLPPSRVLPFAQLLISLFNIDYAQLEVDRRAAESLQVTVSTSVLGTVQALPESEETFAMRQRVESIDPIPLYSVDAARTVWLLSENLAADRKPERVGRQDMACFGIRNTSLRGLAACRLQTGDGVLHLPEARFVFILRRIDDDVDPHRAHIVGRAEILSAGGRSRGQESQPWYQSFARSSEGDSAAPRRVERHISMSLATLLDLGLFAKTPVRKVSTGSSGKIAIRTGWLVSGMLDVEALWKKQGPDWRRRAFILGCVLLIFVLTMTKLILQVVNRAAG